MFKNNKINENFIYLRKKLGYNQTSFAKELNTSQDIISKIENNKIIPSNKIIFSLNSKFKVNLNWLLSGEGEIFLSNIKESYFQTGDRSIGKMTGDHAVGNQAENSNPKNNSNLEFYEQYKLLEHIAKLMGEEEILKDELLLLMKKLIKETK
jgi:transcriptional regulator with XRE-family HTH domain